MAGTRNPAAPAVTGGEVVSGPHVLQGVSVGLVMVVMPPMVPGMVGVATGTVAIAVMLG